MIKRRHRKRLTMKNLDKIMRADTARKVEGISPIIQNYSMK